MSYKKLRPYTAVSLITLFLLMAFTGCVLYIAPHGPGSGQWDLVGIGKHQYKNIHFVLGVLTIVLVLLHSYLNFKPLVLYFKGGRGNNWAHPVIYAFVFVVIGFSVGLLL